ncbi:uncharacterized protein LOC131842869 [Achroia grisella]|uniref:uncharacterized protein LOC131842869 n=1 Tax=Achroia grisella TaxID=688607 RepID=UPI0027D228B4|nr:uncharacterized protein LOC131842869 [Achroia grisella]
MDNLQDSLHKMTEVFNTKMASFRDDLKKVDTPVTVASLAAEFAAFQSFITGTLGNLQQQVELVAKQMDHFEMRSRRKILLLHGVQEHSGGNSIQDVVSVVTEKLKISNFSANDISRSHRVGHQIVTDKPRPILVKLHDQALRNKIWFAKTALRNSGITISEFLTKVRHDAFMVARRHFGIKKCWTRDGFVVVVGVDGTKHRVSTSAEVYKLINSSPSVTGDASKASSVSTIPKASAATTSRPKRMAKK